MTQTDLSRDMQPTIVLENADCAEVLSKLRPNSVDLVVTSPPYFIGKAYDRSRSHADFKKEINRIIRPLSRVLKPGGSLCWQVGYHVDDQTIMPLDWLIHEVMSKWQSYQLRNRIIWTFGHGEHCTRRFSGRHETILWYSRGAIQQFDLDAVRILQKYPGKRHYRGPNIGEFSGNPLGKNPGDVWDIPNVKANHIEKTAHPCQFPVALVSRLINALCPEGGTVLDPYMGSGSTAVAALMAGRNFVGADVDSDYVSIATARVDEVRAGNPKVRPDAPTVMPDIRMAVARRPDHFVGLSADGLENASSEEASAAA